MNEKYKTVLAETVDGITWLTLNRPEKRKLYRPARLDSKLKAQIQLPQNDNR